MRTFSPAELRAAREMARQDLYFYARWMFLQRKGFQWQRARQHKIVCDALTRVYRGECKRLVINIPPRYSKTELIKCFMGWATGHAPDCEWIYTSYSGRLAAASSWDVRGMLQEPEYREIFPAVALRDDSQAKDEWRTTAGGIVYAVGEGGTITGYGAGKHRPGFGGCFPVGTKVWTEHGLLPIDRIVRERMGMRVWAFDYTGRMVLRPVTGWHENPPNEIVRVTFDDGATVECTPDHRFWTLNRGWVRADSLRVDDRLPCVHGGVKGAHHVGVNAEGGSGRLDASPVLAAGAAASVDQGNVSLGFGQDRAQVGGPATALDDAAPAGDGFPCVAAPDLLNHGGRNAVSLSDGLGGFADRVVDGKGLLVGQDGNRVDFGLAEGPMLLAVNDVGGSRVIPQVVESVVARVAVGVADVGATGARPNEGEHDKPVHGRIADLAAGREADAAVPVPIVGELEHAPWCDVWGAGALDGSALTSDATHVADGVGAFIFGDRSPTLVEHVRHDDVTFCLTVKEYHNFTVESGLVVKNCIVIDDPHKADEARSDVIRQGVLDWFQTTLESRKNSPDTPIIVIMQRLHEDDLAGWLLAGGNGEQWEHVCIPVWNDDGTPLWPEKHSAEDLRRMERAAPYVFAGQYRQKPSPPDGGVIKPDMLQEVDAIPGGVAEWCRGWDLGASEGGDYTAGFKVGRLVDGRYIIAGGVREQFATDRRDALIKTTAENDGRGRIKQSLPQDPGQAGKSQVLAFAKLLTGHHVHFSPESGDKVTRATPLASQINAGNVLALRGPWLQPFKDECRTFPNGSFDDQVDAAARGFNGLLAPAAGIHI